MATGKVLVVEDEQQVRILVTRLLEKRGYAVLDAENGRQALHILADGIGELDLVVTDVIMPEMGGAALVRELRRQRPDLPILCMTGYSREEVLSADGLQNIPFIEKPFTPATFLEQVQQLATG